MEIKNEGFEILYLELEKEARRQLKAEIVSFEVVRLIKEVGEEIVSSDEPGGQTLMDI